MIKKILVLAFSAFLFTSVSFAKAETINLSSVKQEQKEIRKQLREMSRSNETLNEDEQKEQVKLSRKYSEITAKVRALEKANDRTENGSENVIISKVEPFSSVPYRSALMIYKPIYLAAGERFGVDWYVLAAIHNVETSFSTISTMVSSAGAIGHMQFMPATFKAYGIDGNGDGQISPWNLEDSIFSAANYLAANNYKSNPRKAIWHYNHADWYVNKVLATAETIKLRN
jgi:membrane-bound lytic murein transglycosylase B